MQTQALNCEPNLDVATNFIMELLPISGPPGHEGEVIRYIIDHLVQLGLPPTAIALDSSNKRSPLGGEVGNLIVNFRSNLRMPRRLLMAHADTVPICVGCKPAISGQRIISLNPESGLGADNRAGTAILLSVAREILHQKLPHPPLTFVWSVQEEVGQLGSRYISVSRLRRPCLAFNFDGGSASKVTIGAGGTYRIRIDIEGFSSHAGVRPEQGVSAIAISSLAIAKLQTNGWLGQIQKGDSLGISNIGYIHSGGSVNVVPDSASILAEVRSRDPVFRNRILEMFRESFEHAAGSIRNNEGQTGKVRFHADLVYDSYLLERTEASVVAAAAAVREVCGEVKYSVTEGGIDANWMNSHGFRMVSLGSGQLNTHSTREALDLDQFHRACRIALRLATASESRSTSS